MNSVPILLPNHKLEAIEWRRRSSGQRYASMIESRDFSVGHNFTAWRNDVWSGLEAMFPR
jgi:hypothetical protein